MHQEKKMLAHISEDGTRVQTVADHLQGTAVQAFCQETDHMVQEGKTCDLG